MGYGYGKDGKTFSYKMGTNNAGLLLKGAKKVPKGTLFFIGQNGQLYMRTGAVPRGRRQVHVRPGVSSLVVPLSAWDSCRREASREAIWLTSRLTIGAAAYRVTDRALADAACPRTTNDAKTPPRDPWRPADCCCCPSARR